MKWIDLSHRYQKDMSVYPNDPSPVIEKVCAYPQVLNLGFSTHLGTHVDARRHIDEDGISIDEIPVSFFQGNAFCIPVDHLSDDGVISLEDVKEALDQHCDVDFILFSCGFEKFWNTPAYQTNFPTLSKELAEYLTCLSLKGIGLDSLSVDLDGCLDIHRILLLQDQPFVIFENLANLKEIENQYFHLFGFPLNIKDADGSLVRVTAEIKGEH